MTHPLPNVLRPGLVVFGVTGGVLLGAQPALAQMFEQPHEQILLPFSTFDYDSRVVVDVDGDGYEDIVTGGRRVSVLWNDGTGHYAAETIASDDPNSRFEVAAGDRSPLGGIAL